MTEVEIRTLLDAHDALIAAWIDGSLSLATFVASYGEFPRGAGIDEHAAAETRHLLPLFRRRLAFHPRVAAIVAAASVASSVSMADQTANFMEIAIGRRLRELGARYPDYEAGADTHQSARPG